MIRLIAIFAFLLPPLRPPWPPPLSTLPERLSSISVGLAVDPGLVLIALAVIGVTVLAVGRRCPLQGP